MAQFELVTDLGWFNTYAGLVAPFLAFAFGTFMIRQAFLNTPRDLRDASDRDAAMLGDATGKSRFDTDEEKTDPLKVGGTLYLRAQGYVTERTKFQDVTFSSPDLLDAYLDARPHDLFATFGSTRVTTPEAATTRPRRHLTFSLPPMAAEIKFATRRMVSRPAFTLFSVVTLALAIASHARQKNECSKNTGSMSSSCGWNSSKISCAS